MSTLLALALVLTPPPGDKFPDGAIARLGSPQWRNVADTRSFLTFTPDGRGIIVAHGNTLRAVDFESGHELWKAPPLDFDLKAASMPGDRLLMTFGNHVKVFKATDGSEEQSTTVDFRDGINPASDGRYVALCDKYFKSSGAVVVFNLASGQRVWEHGGQALGSQCNPVGFANEGLLVTRVYDRPDALVRVLDIKAQKTVREWKIKRPADNSLTPAALSPDGKLLFTGGDNMVRLWDVATGKEVGAWAGHTDALIAGAFSADGKRLLTAAGDRTLRWWDVTTGKQLGKIDLGRRAWQLAISPKGERAVVVCGGESTPRRFDLAAGRELPLADGHTDLVEQLAFLPDSKSLLTAGRDGTVRVWDIAARRTVRQWKPKCQGLAWIAVSADGKLAATASYNDKLIEIWDIATGSALHSFSSPSEVGCMAFSPTGQTLAVGSYGPSKEEGIRLLDASNGRVEDRFSAYALGVSTVRFHPNGRWLVCAPGEYALRLAVEPAATSTMGPLTSRLIDRTTRRTKSLPGHVDRGAVFTPDGHSVLVSQSGSRGNGALRLFELATGQERLTTNCRPGLLNALAVSSDGRYAATSPPYEEIDAQAPPRAYLWDLESGKLARRFDAGVVWTLAFSPDGKLLATGCTDGTIFLWDVSKLKTNDPRSEVNDALWTNLAGDAPTAYQAIVKLGHAGEPGVTLLRAKLKTAKPIDPKRLSQLFADLESERFAVRQKAATELAALEVGAAAFKKQLEKTTSAEARKTLTKLLEAYDGWLTNAERLREVRAVEALQRNATPAARKLLAELAAGAPSSRLTQEAKEALQRWSKSNQ